MSKLDPFILKSFGPPPPGLDIYEERGTRNGIVTGVLLLLAILSVLARWASSKISGSRLHVDDYVIFVALVGSKPPHISNSLLLTHAKDTVHCERHYQHHM